MATASGNTTVRSIADHLAKYVNHKNLSSTTLTQNKYSLFKKNDGSMSDVTFTLSNGEKLHLHSIILINVPTMRASLLGLNGVSCSLPSTSWRAIEENVRTVHLYSRRPLEASHHGPLHHTN